MNLRQLRFVCEVVDQDLSISRAAVALHTSQPSVSRQIQELEDELGFAIFQRSRRRILEITPRGHEVLRIARSMQHLVGELNRLSESDDEYSACELTIAASHAYARYSLPSVIEKFKHKFPNIRLVLRQSDPGSNAELVRKGQADLMISAKPVNLPSELVFLACRQVKRLVLAPRDHPIAHIKQLTYQDLARYPLITYDKAYEAYGHITHAFQEAGVEPDIVLTATDISLMKTYVLRGLGIAVVASLAYQADEDKELWAGDVTHLFGHNTTYVGLRHNAYMPSYVYKFIEMFEPTLTTVQVRKAVADPLQSVKSIGQPG